jgi:hypothetical protein
MNHMGEAIAPGVPFIYQKESATRSKRIVAISDVNSVVLKHQI